MTLNELSQLYYIKKEIRNLKNKLYELDPASQPTATRFNNSRNISLSSPTENIACKRAEYEKLIEHYIEKLEAEKIKIEKYIETIDDSLTRQIFRARLIDGHQWTRIALDLGGNNTDIGVKLRYYRYIKKNK